MKIASYPTKNPNLGITFCATPKMNNDDDENPISKLGERETLLKATAIAGLGFGARALWYIAEDTTILGDLFETSGKLVEKNKKGVTGVKKSLIHLGAWSALCVGFVGLAAAVYTLYKTPNIMYDGKINAFTKGKDMTVYTKSNKIERELYDQMNDKAKDATAEEKKVLAQQYLKLKAAKNQTPDFIN